MAIQRQLGRSTSVEVAYVGNKGTKLETNIPFNRPVVCSQKLVRF